MAQRSIREIDGKKMLSRLWDQFFPESLKLEYCGVLIDDTSDLNKIESENK